MENQYLVSVSHTPIGDMLNTNELKPHLSKYWCIPKLNDATFVANMEDVLSIYEMPYNLSDGELREAQTANHFSNLYSIDCAVPSVNA